MMAGVFQEINRVLKPNGTMTVVFHSAKTSVWHALTQAYTLAGFSVKASSVLDKVQTSFKQTAALVSVRGDPVLLLERGLARRNGRVHKAHNCSEDIIQQLLKDANDESLNPRERSPDRLYSRYVTRCLTHGLPVAVDAKLFYERVRGIHGLA
jgi:hypothetical protein